ncbi:Gfo/Idh/MocA family oxidoreductase [Verrucomicrobiaceae bacterium N1E253]|uniref:Gfo/Idh/MocA family oxidoreductase n=1 Tax=Oceaniferula marina TaxID=2748318 RepID=A0A851GNN8_9BACT|nr:Gfo/Idh/MocA family oxidoreductase [Oceaniferula marina]NWK56647.1 Gfo/Idh/MocA family oxidoreductase [Oceaniferula marina]
MSEKITKRRTVLKTGGVLAAGAVLPQVGLGQGKSGGAGSSEIKVALIGCGGRGTGAANQTLHVKGTKLVAMADAFEDRLEKAYRSLKGHYKERVDVPKARKFVGFDAYKAAIDAADVVILTSPPGFRPRHFEYAVEKGKHVFMEKPVAVDAEGVRQVLAAAKEADKKKLKVVAGLQRRYQESYLETYAKLQEGAIGEILSAQCYWNGGGVWNKPRKEGMTEMEYQMRNWYYFNWLSGDHICEQHIHNIDIVNWFVGKNPVKAIGVGGRSQRIGKNYGEIFDHHYVEFTYDDGRMMNSQCRHWRGCPSRVTEIVIGEKGTASAGLIKDHKGKIIWRHRNRNAPNPYQQEHNELYRHIREDKPLNNAYYAAEASMSAILGRMVTYSGLEISWDKALKSGRSIMPKEISWDADPGPKAGKDGLYPCPIPGKTKVI